MHQIIPRTKRKEKGRAQTLDGPGHKNITHYTHQISKDKKQDQHGEQNVHNTFIVQRAKPAPFYAYSDLKWAEFQTSRKEGVSGLKVVIGH